MVAREPAERVEVERDGLWCLGVLRGWRQLASGWHGDVQYTMAAGRQYSEWVPAARIRQRQED